MGFVNTKTHRKARLGLLLSSASFIIIVIAIIIIIIIIITSTRTPQSFKRDRHFYVLSIFLFSQVVSLHASDTLYLSVGLSSPFKTR